MNNLIIRIFTIIAVSASILIFHNNAYAQINLDTDLYQGFEDSTAFPPPEWYFKTAWKQVTTAPHTGTYHIFSTVNAKTDFGHAYLIYVSDPGVIQIPGKTLIESISVWYRIANASANPRYIRIMATDEWPRIWDVDDYYDADPDVLVNSVSSEWDQAQWYDLTGWVDIRNATSYDSVIVTDTNKLILFDGADAWIGVFAKSETTSMTLRMDDFSIVLNKPTYPNSPTPLSPSDGDSFHTPIIDFSWIHNDTDGSPQGSFQIQISTDSTFSTINDTYDGYGATDTSTTFSTNLTWPSDSIIYWRVRTSNYEEFYSEWSNGDSWIEVKLHVPDTPILLAPPNAHETSVRSIRFQWFHNDQDSTPQSYAELQVSTSPIFSSSDTVIITDSSQFYDTTFSLSTDTIYWRVRTADLLDIYSPFSDSRSLIFVPEDTPIITNVLVTSDTPARAKISSAFDTGVTGDTVWIGRAQIVSALVYATSRRFDSIYVTPIFDSNAQTILAPSPCTAVFFITSSSVNKGDTFAQIVAWDRSGITDTTKITFRMDTTAPTKVALSSPSNNSVETPVPTFSWSSSADSGSGLSNYLIQVSSDSFFNSIIKSETSASTSLTLSSSLSESIFWWRVLPFDSVGNYDTILAETRSLIIDSTPPTISSLIAPENNYETSQVPILFTWTASTDTLSGLMKYIIQIGADSTFSSVDTTADISPSDTFISAGSSLSGSARYWWRILSMDTAGNISYSDSRSFILDTEPPSIPVNTSPSNALDTNLTTIKFKWSSSSDTHTGIGSYQIQISNSSIFASYIFDSSAGAQTETTFLLPANDTYWWRVIAYDSVGNYETGAAFFLRIDTAPPTAPNLLAPISGDTRWSPAGLYWSSSSDSISGVAGYRIQVASDSTFTLLHTDSSISPSTTFDTVIIDTGIWFWRVIANDSSTNSDTSTTETFEIVLPPDTTPPLAFSLTAPTDGYETTGTSIAFAWQDALDSTLPVSYLLVVMNSSGNIVDSNLTNSTSSVRTIPANDSFTWYVIATDPILNFRYSSESFVFTIDTAPPTKPILLSPSSGSETASPVAFRWSASSDSLTSVDSYRIQISLSPSISGAIVLDSYQTATETSIAFEPDTYYWRVSVYDILNNSSTSETSMVVVYYSGESAVPKILSTSASPSNVTNIGSDTIRLTVIATDSSSIDTVIVDLSRLGASYSVVVMDTTSDTTKWQTTITVDTSVIEDTYNLPVYVTDEWMNTESSSITFHVSDVSPSYTTVSSLPELPLGETSIPIAGNVLTIIAEPYGETSVTSVYFEYRPENDTSWLPIALYAPSGSVNPAVGSSPFYIVWDLPDTGSYEIKVTGVLPSGESDPSPMTFHITIQETGALIKENWSSESRSLDYVLWKVTPDTIWFDTIPFLIADSNTITSRDSVIIHIVRYDSAPSDAPAPAGTSDGSGLTLPNGAKYFRVEPQASLDNPVTLTQILSELTTDSISNLSWYRFSTATQAWVKYSSEYEMLDDGRIKLTVQTESFSVWAPLVGLASATLSDVIIYPNPYIPYDNNPRTGVPFVYGVDGTGVIFQNLTNAVTIEVYSVTGKLVTRFSSSNTGGKIHWNVQNDSGKDLSSGIYLVVIKSPSGEMSTKKLMIIR